MKEIYSVEIIPLERHIDFFGNSNNEEKPHILKGDLKLVLSKPLKIKSIDIKFKGTSTVFVTRQRDTDPPDATWTFGKSRSVLSEKVTSPAGVAYLPFALELPLNLPPTIVTALGTIEYKLEATIIPHAILAKDYKVECPLVVNRYLLPSADLAQFAPTTLVKGNRPGRFHYEFEYPKLVCVEQKKFDISVKALPLYGGIIKGICTEMMQIETYRSSPDQTTPTMSNFTIETTNTLSQRNDGLVAPSMRPVFNGMKTYKRSLLPKTNHVFSAKAVAQSWKCPLVIHHSIPPHCLPSIESSLMDIKHQLCIRLSFESEPDVVFTYDLTLSTVPFVNHDILPAYTTSRKSLSFSPGRKGASSAATSDTITQEVHSPRLLRSASAELLQIDRSRNQGARVVINEPDTWNDKIVNERQKTTPSPSIVGSVGAPSTPSIGHYVIRPITPVDMSSVLLPAPVSRPTSLLPIHAPVRAPRPDSQTLAFSPSIAPTSPGSSSMISRRTDFTSIRSSLLRSSVMSADLPSLASRPPTPENDAVESVVDMEMEPRLKFGTSFPIISTYQTTDTERTASGTNLQTVVGANLQTVVESDNFASRASSELDPEDFEEMREQRSHTQLYDEPGTLLDNEEVVPIRRILPQKPNAHDDNRMSSTSQLSSSTSQTPTVSSGLGNGSDEEYTDDSEPPSERNSRNYDADIDWTSGGGSVHDSLWTSPTLSTRASVATGHGYEASSEYTRMSTRASVGTSMYSFLNEDPNKQFIADPNKPVPRLPRLSLGPSFYFELQNSSS